jgi:hypothetical protein
VRASFLLQAQGRNADVLAALDAGHETMNAVKEARQTGLDATGSKACNRKPPPRAVPRRGSERRWLRVVAATRRVYMLGI